MNTGLLILRLWLAFVLIGHAAGKTFGWWKAGGGVDGASKFFDSVGLSPGRRMVYVAGISETTAAIGLGAGVLSPLPSSVAIGTMLVASYAMSPRGVWNVNGGCELALTYAVIAAALGFVGPGRFSLDHAVGWDENAGNGWGSAALGAALFAAGAACLRARSITRRRTNTAGAR